MLIDTHTHLYSSKFDEDRDTVIQNCLDNKITKLLLPNIDSEYTERMLALSKRHPSVCYPMMGIHPCSIHPDTYKEELAHAKEWLGKASFIAIGEIGIDLHWDKTTLAIQQEAFREQISWAKEKQLPVVIHARDSFDEIFEIVNEMNDENLTGIFHCFTGNQEQAQHIIDYGGFKMGVGGVVTFKNSGLDKVVSQFDLNHFVLETDSPYLSPAPHRGKRNESPYLTLIGEKMADIYGCSLTEIAEATTKSALEIFNLD
jgi:TatD DNase family protein|tara:strand:+ start:1453 stop:2226 length:774 start_codon:yes stop_codon:yes gene_type:complete